MKDANNKAFCFEYRTKVSDLWQLSMYYAYSSYLAVINVICIISSIALLVRFYATAEWLGCTLMIIFFLMFTCIQPLGIYSRAKSQLEGNEKDISLEFNQGGMCIMCDGKKQTKHWHEIKSVLIKPTLVAIYVDRAEGYILTNRILKKDRGAFIKYVNEMTK